MNSLSHKIVLQIIQLGSVIKKYFLQSQVYDITEIHIKILLLEKNISKQNDDLIGFNTKKKL